MCDRCFQKDLDQRKKVQRALDEARFHREYRWLTNCPRSESYRRQQENSRETGRTCIEGPPKGGVCSVAQLEEINYVGIYAPRIELVMVRHSVTSNGEGWKIHLRYDEAQWECGVDQEQAMRMWLRGAKARDLPNGRDHYYIVNEMDHAEPVAPVAPRPPGAEAPDLVLIDAQVIVRHAKKVMG